MQSINSSVVYTNDTVIYTNDTDVYTNDTVVYSLQSVQGTLSSGRKRFCHAARQVLAGGKTGFVMRQDGFCDARKTGRNYFSLPFKGNRKSGVSDWGACDGGRVG